MIQGWFSALMASGGLGRDVIWVIGDSLTRKRDTGAAGTTPAAGTVYQFYNGTINEIGSTDIQQNDDPNTNWGSMWPDFGINYYNNTGRKPVLACSGQGGSTISNDGVDDGYWAPGGAYYSPAKDLCDDACAAVGVTHPKYTIIHLGINDAANAISLATIQSDISALLTQINTDYPDTEILIVQIGRLGAASINARIAAIRSYWIAACESFSNVYMAAGLPTFDAIGSMYQVDNVHLSQTGNLTCAAQLGRSVLPANVALTKWARTIVSCHLSELSSGRKTLIQNFVTTVGSALFSAEAIIKLKVAATNDAYLDFAMMTAFYNLGGGTITLNDCFTTNGSSTYGSVNFIPNIALRVTQNNISAEIKIKDNRTASGSFGTALGGGSGASHIRIGQTNTIAYGRINDITSSTFGEAVMADDSRYRTKRTTSTAKTGDKNGTQVFTGSVSSIAMTANPPSVGAMNVSGVRSDFLNGDFEWVIIATPAVAETLAGAMETLCDNW